VGQRFDGQRLGQPGYPLQKDMPVGKQTDQETFDQVLLPNNHLVHFQRDEIYKGTFTLNALIQFANINGLIHMEKFNSDSF
jgi:uncharacterized protein (DUF3820 family)